MDVVARPASMTCATALRLQPCIGGIGKEWRFKPNFPIWRRILATLPLHTPAITFTWLAGQSTAQLNIIGQTTFIHLCGVQHKWMKRNKADKARMEKLRARKAKKAVRLATKRRGF